MTMLFVPIGWCVEHEWPEGQINNFLTLDRTTAENYASRYHGELFRVYKEVPQPLPKVADTK